MTRKFLFVVTAVLVMAAAAPVGATTLSPLSLTGYNYDDVYGPSGGQGGGYADRIDGSPFSYVKSALYAAGTMDKGGTVHDNGLPIGSFTSAADATHTYCLADAGGDALLNNVLWLGVASGHGGQTGTLTLATPRRYDQIGLLAMTADGGSSAVSMVLNYTDGSHSSGLTYDARDWGAFGGGTPPNGGAVHYGRGNNCDKTNPDGFVYDSGLGTYFWLYETVVAADGAKTLQSVTFTGATGSGYTATHVFAISGHEIPEPGTLALLVAGLVGLLCYAWRKWK